MPNCSAAAESEVDRSGHTLVHDEEPGAGRGRRAMGRIAEIGDLIAHARRQPVGSSILQLRVELALQNEEHVAAVTPVVSKVAWTVIDQPDSEIADIESPPECRSGLAGMFGDGHGAPVGDGEGEHWNLHEASSALSAARLRAPTVLIWAADRARDTVPRCESHRRVAASTSVSNCSLPTFRKGFGGPSMGERNAHGAEAEPVDRPSARPLPGRALCSQPDRRCTALSGRIVAHHFRDPAVLLTFEETQGGPT